MDAAVVWLRYLCVLLHIFALALALGTIFREDFKLLIEKNPRLDLQHLHRVSRAIFFALAILWVSGLALIAIDVSADPAKWGSPKLITKLIVVLTLSVNGLVLHKILMPALATPKSRSPRVATMFSVIGAVSMVSWLYAACLGVARPLTEILGFAGFLGTYVILLGGAIFISLTFMRPRIERLLQTEYPPARQPAQLDAYADFPHPG